MATSPDQETMVLPSFMYDEPEPEYPGDWRREDHREERLRDAYERDRRRLEDEEGRA